MAFLLIGLLLLTLKLLETGPTAGWSWWIVLAPFGLAVAWWSFSDAMGFPQARAMRKAEERTAARRAKAIRDLGLDPRQARNKPSAKGSGGSR
ncbi:MAG: TIGR04438 family Trp-rich protein [Rubrivivax sp.]|nr:TIGR04438 family Trp-rich protein [Rubrivivax sp.]